MLTITPFQQRRKEADAKIDSMISSAFGSRDRLDNMYEIRALAVSPKKQGQGYGGALVNTVLTMVRPRTRIWRAFSIDES